MFGPFKLLLHLQNRWSYRVDTRSTFSSATTELARKSIDVIRNVEQAFPLYQQQFNTLWVPKKFIIPSENENGSNVWPRNLQGFHLGAHCAQLRERYNQGLKKKKAGLLSFETQALIGLNFPWTYNSYISRHLILPSCITYRRVYGHLMIPQEFCVPKNNSEWPQLAWGFKLGYSLKNIRMSGRFREIHDELTKLGFIWESVADFQAREVILPALRAYRDIYGDLMVPRVFCIPQKDQRWPLLSWGLHLGSIVQGIRSNGHHASIHESLTELGFMWDKLVEHQAKSVVLPALKTYLALHGDILVPFDFEVPIDDPKWPQNTWGYRLGNCVRGIRHLGNFSFLRDQLDELGFVWSVRDFSNHNIVLPALEAYKRLHGDLLVPHAFVVPSNDANWPMQCWSYSLGKFVHNLRMERRHVSPSMKHELDEMGFTWSFTNDNPSPQHAA